MCGIAGILLAPHRADPRRLSAVRAMVETLRHRGPDDLGIWICGPAGIALGHRRLAIVDLSAAGHQPMASRHLVTTFNGELYNFIEIRKELNGLGQVFRGDSDTEVMLAAFESFGIETSLRRFAGMFAMAIWDRRQRVLHLVRDRLGKKPLYVTLVDGALLFASELRALFAFPGFHPEVDTCALATVLRQGWVPDDECIWQGVFKLPPGTILSVSAQDLGAVGGAGRLRDRARYWWSLAEVAVVGQRTPLALDDTALESELDRLLRLAVRERMVADVPLGAFLSGGIDSAAVVALMQAQSAQPVRTFTIGYREAGYDEAGDAARVAQQLGTEHTEFRLSPAEAYAVIPELPRVWDEPFADESQIPTLLVSRLARRHVTVALTGDGGDESFGGYARHFAAGRLARMLSLPVPPRRAAASVMLALGEEPRARLLHLLPPVLRRRFNGHAMRKLAAVLDVADESELYKRLTSLGGGRWPGEAPAAAIDAVPPLPDLAARFMYRDMARYLPGDILVKLDRASMAVSLEARCPLLDHRIVEFAWRLPTRAKVRDGKGKWLLRRVLRRYLPEALFERPKHGFDVPIGAWLKGPLRDWAEGLLARPRLGAQGLLDPIGITARWQDHLAGRRDRAYELWAVLMVEAWLAATVEAGRARPGTGAGGGVAGDRPPLVQQAEAEA